MNNRRINIPAGPFSTLVENENIVKREELKHTLLNKESNSYGNVEICFFTMCRQCHSNFSNE